MDRRSPPAAALLPPGASLRGSIPRAGHPSLVAHAGLTLSSHGGTVVFETTAADSDGAVLHTRSHLAPGFPVPPRHRHPHQEERFEVLGGRLVVEAGGVQHLLAAGETLTVPPGVAHRFVVPGPEPADVRVSFRPAGGMEHFLERVTELAQAGAISPRGWPPLLRGARLAAAHGDDLRLAGLPGAALRPLVTLARLGRRRSG